MRLRAATLALVLGASCGGAPTDAGPPGPEAAAPPPTARPDAPDEPADPPVRALPRCAAPDPAATRLTELSPLSGPSRPFHVEVVFAEPGGWRPDPFPAMPLHHASRIEWTNLDDFGDLDPHRAERLRLTFRFLSTELRAPSDERAWRATYRAFVDSACSLDASTPPGSVPAPRPLDVTRCPDRVAALVAAVEAGGACDTDADCSLVALDACGVEGLDCLWAAVGAAHVSRVAEANYRLLTEPCPLERCACPSFPSAAACVRGRCAGR